jgi:hypothetical protein
MPRPFADPGYGDPNAPVGSPEWAKRWRLVFQGAVKEAPGALAQCRIFFRQGEAHRAWTLVTDKHGKPYQDFDSFCADAQPWGLGMDPAKFRAYLEAEVGKKAADLATVPPGETAGRPKKGEENPPHDEGDCKHPHAKNERLRAILRAPEVVQNLYREGLMDQTTAARMGPKSPTPEKAALVAEARQELERLDRNLPPREFRKEARRVVDARQGASQPTALDIIKKLWSKASRAEGAAVREWLDAQKVTEDCP